MCLAIPGQIVDVAGTEPLERTARVNFGGILKSVSLACLPEAGVNDYVLVHAGLAIAVVDEAEARQTLADVRTMDALANRNGDAPPDDEVHG